MTPTELEQAIRDLSIKVYCKKYMGEIRVKPIDPVGWTVFLGIHGHDHGITFSAELPDDKFLKFVENELRSRNLDSAEWYTGYRYDDFDKDKDGKYIMVHA